MITRSAWWMVAVVPLLVGTARGHAQTHAEPTLDSLLTAHRYPVTLSETVASGPGFERLLESAAGAQFFGYICRAKVGWRTTFGETFCFCIVSIDTRGKTALGVDLQNRKPVVTIGIV